MNETEELITVDTEDGTVVFGPADTLDEWAASAGQEITPAHIQPGTLSKVAGALPEVADIAAGFLRSRGGGRTEVRRVRRGADGKFAANDLVGTALTVLNPELLVLQAAVGAVSASLHDIQAGLEKVSDGVNELLRAADAERLGDVYGRHRVLRRAVDEVRHGASLTTTDWHALAPLGPQLEVGVERLRRHLLLHLRDVEVDAPARIRAKHLKTLAGAHRVGDLLKLLVVAEEALHNYQTLRLVRIRDTEPEHIDQTVASVRRILDENLLFDNEIADALTHVLNDVGVLRPAEGWDVVTRRSLEASRIALAEDVGHFLDRRHAQARDWQLADSAGMKQALGHFRHVAGSIAAQARRATAGGLTRLAETIDPK